MAKLELDSWCKSTTFPPSSELNFAVWLPEWNLRDVGSHLYWLSIVAWLMILKRKTSIYHPSSFCGSGIQKQFIWVVLALLSLMRLQLRCWLWLQSPEGLTGNEEVFTTQRAHSHHWQVSAGYWQEALISRHMSLLTGLLECPHVMAIGLSQIEGFKARQVESCDLFCDLAL